MAKIYQKYRKKQLLDAYPWTPGEDLTGVSVSAVDKAKGCPKEGDMIGRNPDKHDDRWLIEAEQFKNSYEPA